MRNLSNGTRMTRNCTTHFSAMYALRRAGALSASVARVKQGLVAGSCPSVAASYAPALERPLWASKRLFAAEGSGGRDGGKGGGDGSSGADSPVDSQTKTPVDDEGAGGGTALGGSGADDAFDIASLFADARTSAAPDGAAPARSETGKDGEGGRGAAFTGRSGPRRGGGGGGNLAGRRRGGNGQRGGGGGGGARGGGGGGWRNDDDGADLEEMFREAGMGEEYPSYLRDFDQRLEEAMLATDTQGLGDAADADAAAAGADGDGADPAQALQGEELLDWHRRRRLRKQHRGKLVLGLQRRRLDKMRAAWDQLTADAAGGHALPAGVEEYNLMLQGLASAGRVSSCIKLLLEMMRSEVTPNRMTYNIMLRAAAESGEGGLEKAEAVYDVMRQTLPEGEVGTDLTPNVDTFNGLIAASLRAGQERRAFKWFNKAKNRDVQPNEATFLMLFSHCFSNKQWEWAHHVWRTLQHTSAVRPTHALYSLLLKGFAEAATDPGNVGTGRDTSAELIKVRTRMKSRGMKPTAEDLCNAFNGLAACGAYNDTRAVAADMERLGMFEPTLDSDGVTVLAPPQLSREEFQAIVATFPDEFGRVNGGDADILSSVATEEGHATATA